MRAFTAAVAWIAAVIVGLLAQVWQMKYIVNANGGVHSVWDEYVLSAGEREATGEETAAYQAAFEDQSNQPARKWPDILPDVPTHNPPLAASVVDRFTAPPETLPSASPPGTLPADTKPSPPEWARDNPRVIAGQQAILAAPAAGAVGPLGADGKPTTVTQTDRSGKGRKRAGAAADASSVSTAEASPVPVATELTGAPHPVYTDPVQRTEDAGQPAGTYPPQVTDVGLAVPDDQVVTNDAASVKDRKDAGAAS